MHFGAHDDVCKITVPINQWTLRRLVGYSLDLGGKPLHEAIARILDDHLVDLEKRRDRRTGKRLWPRLHERMYATDEGLDREGG